MKKVGKVIKKCLYFIAFCGCIVVVLYPLISNYLYNMRQDQIITEYEENVKQTDTRVLELERAACFAYNRELVQTSTVITEENTNIQYGKEETVNREAYLQRLNLDGNGVMGYVIIPKIDVYLPISHDTTKEVLESGVGHLPESSLPVGGESSHAVLTGHTGSTNKTIFTDLEKLEEGDVFMLSVLGETLVYQIDQIIAVLPFEVDELMIKEGKDLCTLVTCTPYGINSHRLLVRGKRVHVEIDGSGENPEDDLREEIYMENGESESFSRFQWYYLRAVLSGCLLAAILVVGYLLIRNIRRKYI